MSRAEELADAYADAVSAHRLESLYGTSKSYTLEKARERDETHAALSAELRRLSAVEAELAECKAAYESQFKELHALKATLAASCADERGQLLEATPGGGCSRALDAERELAALKKAISEAEPVAWAVYVAKAQNFYLVDSEEDAQMVDDCTNSDAEVWPLYTLKGIK